VNEFTTGSNRSSDEQLAETLAQLVTASRAGGLAAAEAAQLSQLLEESARARQIYLQMAQDTQALRVWAKAYLERSPAQSAPAIVSASDGIVALPFEFPNSGIGDGPASTPSAMSMRHPPHKRGFVEILLGGVYGFGWKAAAAAACFAFVLTAAIAYRQASEIAALRANQHEGSLTRVDGLSTGTDRTGSPAAPYVATLINLTNCRWDKAEGAPGSDQQGLQPGQSLHLLEGVAEINSIRPSGNRCTFQLEGPLAMTLTREGMPSLLYGKLAGVFSGDSDQFALETPLGRIVVTYDASLGVSATANTVELHVFEGEAFIEPLYSLEPDAAPEHLRAAAGVSLRIVASGEEQLSVERGTADQHLFVSQVSMAANRIHITEKYVEAIRRDRPIAYWRFEGATNGCVMNEIDDRFHCRLYGNGLRWHAYAGNTAAEMGSTPEVCCLLSDDVIDGAIRDNYSLEAWIKPSHFHHAAVFSLAEIPSQTQAIARPRTGMLLELCGPVNSRAQSHGSWARYPGRIRFLHRNPPGSFTGNSCFSEKSYVPRKWQHVVTVKNGPQLRLYVDGALAAEAEDRTELPGGMRVLIGQLHQHDPRRVVAVRPFVGELDEVALYDRALNADQIKSHFQLASPAAGAKSEAAADF
jgi:hypothetical protein